MTDAEIGWLAGLLEGEGSFLLAYRNSTTGPPRPRIIVSLAMNDRDVVERVQQLTGLGKVGVSKRTGRPDCFWWTINRMSVTAELMKRLYPLMGRRRQSQIDKCLDAVVDSPLLVA